MRHALCFTLSSVLLAKLSSRHGGGGAESFCKSLLQKARKH